jgi:hypothetical protein
MGAYQFDAWTAREEELDAQEQFERGGAPEGQEPDWLAFVGQQSEAELEVMYLDPTFWDYVEKTWGYAEAA